MRLHPPTLERPCAPWGLARLAAAVLLLALAGCSSAVPEPEDAFRSLPDQTYPFELVWECSVEAVEAEGHEIDASRREGERGELTTRMRRVRVDALTGTEEARRLRIRLGPAGRGAYHLAVAASRFEREDPERRWSYAGHDPELLQRVAANLERALAARYHPEGD